MPPTIIDDDDRHSLVSSVASVASSTASSMASSAFTGSACSSSASTASKRKRHSAQLAFAVTPRRLKLRKLNDSLRQAPPAFSHLPADEQSSGASSATAQPPSNRRRRTIGAVLLLLSAIGLLAWLCPDARADLLAGLCTARQQFEREYAAFAYDERAERLAHVRRLQQLDETAGRWHERIAHQTAALERLQALLRNHSHEAHRNRQPGAQAHLSDALVLAGGAGTGKSLAAGVLMRDWLSLDAGNVVHGVWQAADERDAAGQVSQAFAQLSAVGANLLVLDSVPARAIDGLLDWHRALLERLDGWRSGSGGSTLLLYVVNVPTFGESAAEDVERVATRVRTTIAERTPDVALVRFASIGGRAELRECIEREWRRMRAGSEMPIGEELVELIAAGIDVRQSGCKHVSARLSMYV